MKITILAVGTKMPRWVDEAYGDYAKRFGRDITLELKEIKPEKRGGGVTAEKALPPSTSGCSPPSAARATGGDGRTRQELDFGAPGRRPEGMDGRRR